MIGDRPDTDMLLAHNAGIDKCLVLTGVVESMDEVDQWVAKDPKCRPSYIMKSLGIME